MRTLVSLGEKAPWELYDLSGDRGEIHKLAARYPDKGRDLANAWQRRLAEFRALATADLPTRPASR